MNWLKGALSTISSLLSRLSPGDKVIAYTLITLFVVSCSIGLVALERSFMVEVPSYGGSLSEGVVGAPRFINPVLAISDTDRDLTALTYAGLMGVGPNGLYPVLAESYEISEDGKTYTFVLRSDARFSDGTPVTAQDVVFTVSKVVSPKLKSPKLADWTSVKAEVVDARTVRFTLTKAYAPFLTNTTLGILPSHIWSSIPDEQFPFTTYMTKPVGAGPFTVRTVETGSDGMATRYVLSRNDEYVLGKAYLDTISFTFFPSQSELLHAYESGAIHSAYGIPVAGAIRSPYSRVFAVFLNPGQQEAFGDRSLRHALSVAVDRGHITETILGGYGEARTTPLPSIEAMETITSAERIAEAKSILEAGGWSYSEQDGVWSNKKKKLVLDEVVIKTSNVPELKSLVEEVEKNWDAIGVKTSIEYYEPNTLATSVIAPRDYAALYFGLVLGREGDLYPFFDSGEKTGTGLNIAQYANKEVDALLEKARSERDDSARLALLEKASTLIGEDYGAIFTHTPYFLYALPKDLKGVILPTITTPGDRFANVSSWYKRTRFVWPIFANSE